MITTQRFILLACVVASMAAVPGSAAQSPTMASRPDVATASRVSGLRPGDAVRVRVWQEPDLSGEFTVDEAGAVNLPKVGLVRVSGVSVADLRSQITAAYQQYVTQPVEITALLRIRVDGAVRTPGLYRVEQSMTLADALALAGGASPEGRADRVRLVRDGRATVTSLSASSGAANTALQSGDQLTVPERGWMNWNPGMLIGAVSAVATLIWATRRDQ